MGYAQEFHVERYMRECFVPRIAPVSRVSIYIFMVGRLLIDTGDDFELYWRKGPKTSKKLLGSKTTNNQMQILATPWAR